MGTFSGGPISSLGSAAAGMPRMSLERQTLGVQEAGAPAEASDPVPMTLDDRSCQRVTATMQMRSGVRHRGTIS